jgi:hypothetical protein
MTNFVVNMLVFKTGHRLARPVILATMRPRSLATTIVRADLKSRIAGSPSAAENTVLVTQEGIRGSNARATAKLHRDDANHCILILPDLSTLDQSTLIPQLKAAVEIVERQQRNALASLGLWVRFMIVRYHTNVNQPLTTCTGY